MGWFKNLTGLSTPKAVRGFDDYVFTPTVKAMAAPFKIYDPGFWEKPAQGFSESVDDMVTGFTPPQVDPYAPQIAGAALSAFNPFLGAAYNTLYSAGKNQEAGGKFSWSDFSKDAAVNFGTAAVANWAKNASAARASKASQAKEGLTMKQGFDANQAAKFSSATPETIAQNSLSSVSSVSPSAVEAFNNGTSSTFAPNARTSQVNANAGMPGTSLNSAPINQLQTSGGGFGDAFKAEAIKRSPDLVNQALTSTLAPEGAQPVSGMESAASLVGDSDSKTQYGDIFRAFGDPSMLAQDENGKWRIDQERADYGRAAIAANSFMQQSGERDRFLPAGQFRAAENTPYDSRLNDIQAGTDQYYKDFDQELQAAGKTKALMQANPWMTQEDVIKYSTDPSKVPETMKPFFTGFQPIFY